MILVLECLAELLMTRYGRSEISRRLVAECDHVREELEDEEKIESDTSIESMPYFYTPSAFAYIPPTVKEETELNKLYPQGPGAGIE